MQRRRLTRAQKVRIFDAARGVCHICQTKIFTECGERWEVEHVKPLWLGGSDNFDNLAPAHVRCHQGKTSGEASSRAKSDRLRALHRGIKKGMYCPLPGTFASGIKLQFHGGPIDRRTGQPWRWQR